MTTLLLAIVFSLLFQPVSSQAFEVRHVVGWIEMSRIYPGNMEIRAKMDTGAKGSSLNAPHLQSFERDGETWVRFELQDQKKGKTVLIEKKVLRVARIKRKKGGIEERFVIRIGICLANRYRDIEVNLTDRRRFNYQLLIGRDDLIHHFNFIVDPSVKFTAKPNCTLEDSSAADAPEENR